MRVINIGLECMDKALRVVHATTGVAMHQHTNVRDLVTKLARSLAIIITTTIVSHLCRCRVHRPCLGAAKLLAPGFSLVFPK